MKIQDAKAIDLVDYLQKIGITPAKISGSSYWYLSPLHKEKTPSFKINRRMNRWYDFAEGIGGNLIDFGTRFHKCDVSTLLQRLNTAAAVTKQHQTIQPTADLLDEHSHQIKILSVQPLQSYPLLNYLHMRRIAEQVAQAYLHEVHYTLNQKNYFALGFKNDAGGYELRNQYVKISSSPKDITFIDNKSTEIAVFEGFFDFLSYKNMYYKQEEPARNYMVLNSASFFEKSLSKMQEHQKVHLYFDNDATGEKITQKALAINKEKFSDERSLYKKYPDLNEWLIKIGNPVKQQLRHKL